MAIVPKENPEHFPYFKKRETAEPYPAVDLCKGTLASPADKGIRILNPRGLNEEKGTPSCLVAAHGLQLTKKSLKKTKERNKERERERERERETEKEKEEKEKEEKEKGEEKET